MTEQQSIFNIYTHDLFTSEKPYSQALKDHPIIPIMVDTLSRKHNHHIALEGMQSEKLNLALLETLALLLTETNTPKALRNTDFIYFDAKRLTLNSENPAKIMRDFFEFSETIRKTNKIVIIAINEFQESDPFGKLIRSILNDDHWRVIVLNSEKELSGFSAIKFITPGDSQLIALLKIFKTELENFHQVLIPDETVNSALSLASHYLTTHSPFDKALELLDSAAARASAIEIMDPISPSRPIVSSTLLAEVVSSLTQIPVSHLHNNVFQASKFIEALHQRIFGQDAAITAMGGALQHACIKIQEKTGPLCSFLLVGPPEVGKTTAAYTIAQHLFGHNNSLLHVNLNDSYHSIADVKITTEDNNNISLLTAILQTPYAVVLIENIHHAPITTLNLFKNIFSHGFALDNDGKKYDFHHAIFVITTTLGAERISTLTQAPPIHETNKTLDLMQLVLNDHTSENDLQIPHHFSQHDLSEELRPTLEAYFPAALLSHLQVVPFLPLEYTSFEKIIRLKVKAFAKRLETHFSIELSYAPEIIKFLAHEALWRKPQTKTLEKLLEQHLYSAVANEILAYSEDKNRPKRLVLRLNDDGQLLRCEFVNSVGATIYNM